MDAKALLSDTKKIVKSLIIPYQTGIKLRQLCNDFHEIEGKHVPYKELGFNSLTEFLGSIPDVLRMRGSVYDAHNMIIYPVADETTRHMVKMVASQKKQPKKRNEAPIRPLRQNLTLYAAKTNGQIRKHLDMSKLINSKEKSQPTQPQANGETMISNIELILSENKLTSWFSTGLQDEYYKRFQQVLPPNWIDSIKGISRFEVTEIPASNVTKILIALKLEIKKRDSVSSKRNSISSVSSCSSPNPDEIISNGIQVMPNPLLLPDGETWDIIVLNPVNTSEIYLRLIDTSDDYAQLMQEMHNHYQSKSMVVKQVIEGRIYVNHFDDATFRVMAKSQNSDSVKCFFVDEGLYYDINQSNLHEIETQFLKLPFQAFCCSLSEIEYFNDSSIATSKLLSLVNALEEPVFVCKPITREPNISITLYDVAGAYDRDINAEIITFMQTHAFDDILTVVDSQCKVYVSYCTANGDIYAQIDHPFYQKYENLKEKANELCNASLSVPEEHLLVEELNKTTKSYYYAKCDGEWFRCLIINLRSVNQIVVYFVDFGDIKMVALSEIRSLDIDPLKTIPYLAIKVRLNCEVVWSDSISALFMNLMRSDLQIMKVVKPIDVDRNTAIVELWDNMTLISENLIENDNNNANNISNGDSQTLKPFLNDKIGALNVVPNDPFEDDVINGGKEIPKPILPKINPNPHDSNDFFDVVVLRAATPFNFIVVPLDDIYLKESAANLEDSDFSKMVKNMYEFYEREENRIDLPQLVLKKDKYFAGKHDNHWNRIRIVGFHSQNPVVVMALLIDYGDIHHFQLKDIQPLFNEFRQIPIQAINATLATVEPINLEWDPLACFEFSRMVRNKPFVAIVHDIKSSNGEPLLMLSLYDTSGDNDVSIDNCLIERELAQQRKSLKQPK